MTSSTQDSVLSSVAARPKRFVRWLPHSVGTRIAWLISSEDLKAKSLRGAAWTIIGYGFSQALRLAANLILTRLLLPEAFGLMALVNVFIQGLQMFSDVGIGPAIVTSKRGEEPNFLNTAWTIQVVRGLALWVASCIVAWPLAEFYGEPMLMVLIPIAGFSAFVQGFQTAAMFTAHRQMDVRRVTTINLLSQTAGTLVMLIWAWCSPTVLALTSHAIASATAALVIAYVWLPPHAHQLRWDKEDMHELLNFGKWIFLTTALSFVALNGDRLVFGKILSMDQLGVFSIALMFSRLILNVQSSIGGSVVFPMVSKLNRDDSGRVQECLTRARMTLLSYGGLASTLLIVFGSSFISLVYPASFHDAGWMLEVFVLGVLMESASVSYSPGFVAIGNPKATMQLQAITIVIRMSVLALGYAAGGIVGSILGFSLSSYIVFVFYHVYARYAGIAGTKVDALYSLYSIGVLILWLFFRGADL